jgi:hypothetical protein
LVCAKAGVLTDTDAATIASVKREANAGDSIPFEVLRRFGMCLSFFPKDEAPLYEPPTARH